MENLPINIPDKLGKFSELWAPKIIARMNDYHFKLVKIRGGFVWHDHPDTDEVFFVLGGQMVVHFRDRDVTIRENEMFVVPKGVEHRTSAGEECRAMIVELAGTVNTGTAGGDMTAPADEWI